MIQESVLVDTPKDETIKIVKNLIGKTFGNVSFEDSRHIVWSTRFGLQTVQCETHIISHGELTEITTFSHTDDIWQTGAKKTIKKFYTTLFQNPNIRVPQQEPKFIDTLESKGSHKEDNDTKASSSTKWGLIITGVLIFTLLISSYFSENGSKADIYVTKQGYYGTTKHEDLKKVLKLANQGEQDVLNQLYNEGFYAEVPEGIEVYLEESKWGAVKIRAKGTNLILWTVKEAIKD